MTELFLTVLQMSLMAAGVVLIALPPAVAVPAAPPARPGLRAPVAGGGRPHAPSPWDWSPAPFPCWAGSPRRYRSRREALARTEEIVLLPAAPDPAPPAEPAPSFALPEAVPAPEEAAPAAEGLSVLDVLAWLWLAGVLAVWGDMALAWLRLRRRLATAVWRGSAQMGWWWESDRIPTAFVFGFFTPVCTFPPGWRGKPCGGYCSTSGPTSSWGTTGIRPCTFSWQGCTGSIPCCGCPGYCWAGIWRWRAMRRCSAAPAAARGSTPPPCWPWPRPTGAPAAPGFGETGVKDRIRRALKWKPAAPWMAAVLFVLAVALGLLLLNDPPFPDPTVNGQYPTLRIQMEQDGPGGAGGETVVDMGVPEAATWPEELPEAERTASTPRPWVSLYLDNGAFPSRWTMTEYLVENGQAVRAREVGLSPMGRAMAGCSGWRAGRMPRARAWRPGCTSSPAPGRRESAPTSWSTHSASICLRCPWPPHRSGGGGGDTRVDLDGDASRHGGYGLFSAYHHPGQRGLLCPGGTGERTAAPRVRGREPVQRRGAAPSVSAWNIWAVAPRALPPTRPSIIPLTYTWADGTTESRAFTLYAYTPRPEWDDEGLRIRYPGDTEVDGAGHLDPRARRVGRTGLGGPGRGGEPGGSSERHRRHERRPQRLVRVRHRPRRRGRGYLRLPHPRRGRTWQETGRPDLARMMWVPLLHLFHRQLHWLPGSELFQRRAHLPHH